MKGFDLEVDCLKHRFGHAVSPYSLKAPRGEEFELKYAVDNIRTFSEVASSLPILQFERAHGSYRPMDEIFLISPDYFYKDYKLANFALDTVDHEGTPLFGIYKEGYQLRQRFSVRPHLAEDAPYAFGLSQCSVKNLFSWDSSSRRVEIEQTMDTMGPAAALFLKSEQNFLPAALSRVDADLLRVSSAFMTSRGSYMMGVHVDDAIVMFEVSNDQVTSLTPDLNVTRRNFYEWEPEGKEIVFLRDAVAVSPAQEAAYRVDLLKRAEVKIRAYVDAHFAGQLSPVSKSKLERAMDDTHDHYVKLGHLFGLAAANDGKRPKTGSYFALAHNITMGYIANRKSCLRRIANEMSPAGDLVNVPHIKKRMLDVRAADTPKLHAA